MYGFVYNATKLKGITKDYDEKLSVRYIADYATVFADTTQ